MRNAYNQPWKMLFQEHILDRGYDYFCEGAVHDLEIKKDALRALVSGTDTYDVKIKLKDGRVQDLFCSCPYAEKGTPCKHMAAVLFEWECETAQAPEETPGGQEAEPEAPTVEELVAAADEAQLRKFLTALLEGDEKLLSRFKILVLPEGRTAEVQKLKGRIDSIIKRNQGRHDYIPYERTENFAEELHRFLYDDVKALIDHACYSEALELTNYIYLLVAQLEIDDPDGEVCDIFDACEDMWDLILEFGDITARRQLFRWLLEQLDSNANDSLCENLETTLMEKFHSPEWRPEMLALSETRGQWDPDWAMEHIELLEDSGAAEEEIASYCQTVWQHQAVREYAVKRYMAREEYEKAEAALKESLDLDAAQQWNVSRDLEQLSDLYQTVGNTEGNRNVLFELVTKHESGKIDRFKELKAATPPDEWETVRTKVFEALPTHTDLAPYYAEEGLYAQLFSYIKSKNSPDMFNRYLDVLAPHYPEELLDLYEKRLLQEAQHTANRTVYRDWVEDLRRMQTIPGGKVRVNRIVTMWKKCYSGRSAMMDELRRL